MAENIDRSNQNIEGAIITPPVAPSWGQLGVCTYAKIVIILALFYYLFRVEISAIVSRWSDPSWSHGFLIPLFSLYFINQHKEEILQQKIKPSYWGLFFMICGILFYPLNIIHFQYGYFRPLGMIATLGTIVLFLGGWRLLRYMWLPVGFLIFAVPLPQRYYVFFTMPMRVLAAQVSTGLLNLVDGMNATVNGVVIDVLYNGERLEPALNVAEACSGMRLLMAFLALGVAMAYLHYRPAWQRLVLLVTTIPIAILCNIIRVSVTGFIYILLAPKYAEGLYHDALGMIMLPLAFGMYGVIAWFMSSLFVEEEQPVVEDIVVRKSSGTQD